LVSDTPASFQPVVLTRLYGPGAGNSDRSSKLAETSGARHSPQS
jgi:hypothetical protein